MPKVIAPNEPTSVFSEIELAGEWNDITIEGFATSFYDAETNVNGGVLNFEDVPELGNALMAGSKYCWLSIIKCAFSRPTAGAVNLISVTGLPFTAEVDYTLVYPNGNVLGQLQQTFEIAEVAPGHLKGRSEMNGTFDGPKNIKWSPGYPVYLRQIGPGLIEGVYGQTMLLEDGGRFFELVRRRYSYNNDNTLPFDVIWNYKMLSANVEVKEGRRIFDYRATAYYVPAKADHGPVEHANQVYEKMLKEKILVSK